VTLTISDVQRRLKEKVLPLMEIGEEIIVEDAKNHEKKFMIVPIRPQAKVRWPDFTERARDIKSDRDLTEFLLDDRGRY
jgi:hypothetical protein